MPMKRDELNAGDIILTKSQVFTTGFNPIHATIRFGQLFSKTNGGSSEYVHAQIVLPAATENEPRMVAEADSCGLVEAVPESVGTVFRLDDGINQVVNGLPPLAAGMAAKLVDIKKKNKNLFEYGVMSAGFSLFRWEKTNDKSTTVLEQIADGTYAGKWFCSMFVVVCYQLAVMRANKSGGNVPNVIDANAHGLSPASLHGYFIKYANVWKVAGEYDGK